MRIGYAKLGRNMQFNVDKYGAQGDPEAPNLLRRLALRNPEHEWWVVGKNSGYDTAATSMPSNVVNVWADGIPRGHYHQEAAASGYVCGGCKQPLPDEGPVTCCARGQGAWEADQYVAYVTSQLDGMVVHVGQHGTSSIRIPQSNDRWTDLKRTTPQCWSRNYCGYLIQGMNWLGDRTDGRAPVAWVCVDPRNYLKARDVKWPTGTDRILAQYFYERDQRHERYLDPRDPGSLGFEASTDREGEIWTVRHKYVHSGAELMILDDDWATWGHLDFEHRTPVGVASTSAWVPEDRQRRSWLIRKYVFDNFPDAEVYGSWDAKSLKDVQGFSIHENAVSEFHQLLGSWRVTVSLQPTSRERWGEGWSVAKAYQCFAARVACFMVGKVDGQGWVLPSTVEVPRTAEVAPGLWSARSDWTDEDLHLARWLRVRTPEEFAEKAKHVSQDRYTWEWLTGAQRSLLSRRWDEAQLEKTIESMLGIGG